MSIILCDDDKGFSEKLYREMAFQCKERNIDAEITVCNSWKELMGLNF